MFEGIRRLIEQCGFEEYPILEYLLPSIRLSAKQTNESEIPVGKSKLGGRPDLPKELIWPQKENFIYSFIGQFNCKEMQKFSLPLPKEGMLYFFYAYEEFFRMSGRFEHKDICKVIYSNDDSNLYRVEFPDNVPHNLRYHACEVVLYYEITIPDGNSSIIEALQFSSEEYDRYYDEFMVKYQNCYYLSPDFSYHRILGHPDIVQNDIINYANIVYSNKSSNDVWRLLLQIDSDSDHTGMNWGDNGRLFFLISEQDLVNKQFEFCTALLQC